MIDEPIFKIIMDTIENPIIITDGNEMTECNTTFIDFFNYDDLEHFKSYHKCVCDLFVDHSDYFSMDMVDENILWTDYLYDDKNNEHIVSMLNKDGDPKAFNITINRLDEYKSHYIIVFTDVTAIQNEKKLLEKMAYFDPLTNIYNRQMFRKLLFVEKENKKRYGDDLSLIMFDLDHFKSINDTYGHDIGDKVLITLSRFITKKLRVNDVFSRWGGEEFMILLPRTNIQDAYKKALELKELMDNYVDDILPHFTASFGVTEIYIDDKNQAEFIRVDKALYKAKEKRNCVVKL